MVPTEHMFLLYMCIEMYANNRQKEDGYRRAARRPGQAGCLPAQRRRAFRDAPSTGPQLPDSSLPCVRAVDPGFFSSSSSFLTSKVNLFTVIFFGVNYLP